ncbi:MAG TPA: hypothetical protein VKH37_01615, partial [Ferruginibacter sp.]|nr:hypothetical protein [Ferruginibacter sp.]
MQQSFIFKTIYRKIFLTLTLTIGILSMSNGQNWAITGNASTNPPTHFLGTTDAKALVFKVNNSFSGLLDYNVSTANTTFGFQS